MSAYNRLFRTALQTTTNTATGFCMSRVCGIQACGYAKKVVVKKKGMVKEEMQGPDVCKDPVRLTSYAVGANIFKTGEDPLLKPPEEYPEWLFQIHLGPPKKLHELETDDRQYWKVLRKENMWRWNKLHKGKKI